MNQLKWRPIVEDFSRVMKLVHLAARRDDVDVASISAEVFREKRAAYQDELTIQAANVGCAGRKGYTPPDVMKEMREEADREAESIVNTYNYDLAHAIRHIKSEVPWANRHTYAKRLGAWEEERTAWKSKQIALWNTTKWVDRAQKDFYEFNAHLLQVGYAIVQPQRFAVCDLCRKWVDRGKVPIEEAKRVEWPAHLNCPHHWVFHYDKRKKIDCNELWVGAPLQSTEEAYGMRELGEKGGAGSGNWGHAGRPGMVGGSAGRGGPTMSTEADMAWVGALEKGELNAVKAYMNVGPAWAGSSSINTSLREGNISGRIADNVKLLDAAIDKAPIVDKPTKLYRSVPGGASVSAGEFVSAMRQRDYVKEYSGPGRDLVEFEVPAGTHIAPVSAIFFPYSEEVLLPRSVEITEISRVSYG